MRKVVDLEVCGQDDPDGLRAATVLIAYFRVERTRVFRRGLWHALRIIATIWLILGLSTPVVSTGTTLRGLVILGFLACWAGLREWTAASRLSALLAGLPHSVRSSR